MIIPIEQGLSHNIGYSLAIVNLLVIHAGSGAPIPR